MKVFAWFGIAVFGVLGIASVIAGVPGPVILLVAIGVFVMVLLLRDPSALDHDAAAGRSLMGVIAWIVGGVGLAVAIVALVAGSDALLFLGVIACLVGVLIGASVVQRRLPSDVGGSWWSLGRRAFGRDRHA